MAKRTVLACRYHRNGVSGEDFFTVRFTDPEASGSWGLPKDAQLVAVLPNGWQEQDDFDGGGERCYVFPLSAPELCYRGDHFTRWARDVAKAASEDMSAHRNPVRDAKIDAVAERGR